MHVTGFIEEAFEHDRLLTRNHTEHGFCCCQVFDQLRRSNRVQLEFLLQVLLCRLCSII